MGTEEHPWPAPVAHGPVTATVPVPGSKSMTNRALLLAALADGASTISAPLRARDTELMAGALRALGTAVVDGPQGQWVVSPGELRGPAHIDCGLAGTVMRFVPPLAACATGDIRFDGDPRARVRPMSAIVTALESLGATIDDDGRGTLPFTVIATGAIAGGEVTLDASASSQFVSALLLAAPKFRNGVVVRHVGAPVPSMPHIDMSVAMLRERGITVTTDTTDPTAPWWQVDPGTVRALDTTVEPDLSNAAAFLAAAVVTGGTVTIPGWPGSTTQAGDALRHLFAAMGAHIDLDERGLTVTGPAVVQGIDADLHDVGELTPVLAAVCALAASPSTLRGISHLRGHETDRLAALTTELSRVGSHVVETADGLVITPRPLHGALLHTYDDHRMAHAAAVLGLCVPHVTVVDIGTTAKTLPGFAATWRRMLDPSAAA